MNLSSLWMGKVEVHVWECGNYLGIVEEEYCFSLSILAKHCGQHFALGCHKCVDIKYQFPLLLHSPPKETQHLV